MTHIANPVIATSRATFTDSVFPCPTTKLIGFHQCCHCPLPQHGTQSVSGCRGQLINMSIIRTSTTCSRQVAFSNIGTHAVFSFTIE